MKELVKELIKVVTFVSFLRSITPTRSQSVSGIQHILTPVLGTLVPRGCQGHFDVILLEGGNQFLYNSISLYHVLYCLQVTYNEVFLLT